MTNRIPVGVFFALFTISGFAGLIYQSIWSHYLKLFLGHAAYAQTLVLAIFMGGMAIGSWLVSRYTHRIRDLLLGYAIAELGIGILAIAFHGVFQGATAWAFDTVLPALGGSGGVDAFKWTLASALILPASILLGTTFPLMSAGIMRVYPEASGKALSMLYFTNSFGAAIGVLVSGFYLIDKLGLPGTILTAGTMNVALAFVVWLITKRIPTATPVASAPSASSSEARVLHRAVLALAFATGAASFIYEITWIRMLTLGLGASTHSFEVMLAAFILGMSLGAYFLRNRIGGIKSDVQWLAALLVLKAVFAVYAVWIYGDVLDFIQWMMQATARTDGGYVLTTFAGLVASIIVMFPTAFCAGMTLPLATNALTARGMGEESIGKVYGANTAGCILGAAFATHVGMEAFGVKGLTGVGAFLDAAFAAIVVLVAIPKAQRLRGFAAIAVLFVAAGVTFSLVEMDLKRMASGVFRYGAFVNPKDTQIRYYSDGKTATISVLDIGTLRTIRTNGKPDASIALTDDRRAAQDEATMLLAAAIPLALKPDAKEIANIGWGSGLTTHSLLGSTKLASLDSIEIERSIIEGAKLFAPRNDRAYKDPRSHIHIEDAKTFFASHGKKYDVIVSEPSNPWVSGVSTLFSEEFYSQVKRYIKDDGLLVQWVQVYEIDVGLLSTIFIALGKHFPDYVVYTPTVGDLIIVATPGPAIPKLTGELFTMPGIKADLAHLGYTDLGDIAALRVGSRALLEPLFNRTGYQANSDYFPIIDQRAPRSRFKRESADDIRRARDALVPFVAMVDEEYRTPLERLYESGRNRPIRIGQALVGAEAVGIFLTGQIGNATVLPVPERMQAAFAHESLDDCSKAKYEWVDAVAAISASALPFLSRESMAPMFERIEASKCYKSLDEVSKRRIALFKAINERDAVAMSTNAEALLANLPPKLEGDRATFVLAAMTGYLAKGRRTEARTVWSHHADKIPESLRAHFVTRLAVNYASSAEPDKPWWK